MTPVFAEPNSKYASEYTYYLHYVHIEDEDFRTASNTSVYKIRVGKFTGWVVKNDVTVRKESARALEDVSLRAGPSMRSDVVDLITANDELDVYDVDGDFLYVEYRGNKGYIPAEACDHEEPKFEGKNDGERAVSIAKSKLGCPYQLVEEATGPYIFDCSGLMLYTYNRLDIPLNRTADRQIYGLKSLPVDDIDSWLPGDVITFYTSSSRPDYISHVAMYIGNHEFIHASTNKYRVRIDNIDQYPYRRAHVARYFEE